LLVNLAHRDLALPADPPRSFVPPAGVESSAETEGGQMPRRILIVEDEVFVRLDIERELSAAGFDVVGGVDTAQAAIALADRERPDLVLMDVRIAGPQDGVSAALELWSRFQIRCLFVSANLDAQTRQRAAAAQPWGFVKKPFSGAELLAAIKRAS
jgi:DNA-binding NarL/FixJ family response regulator